MLPEVSDASVARNGASAGTKACCGAGQAFRCAVCRDMLPELRQACHIKSMRRQRRIPGLLSVSNNTVNQIPPYGHGPGALIICFDALFNEHTSHTAWSVVVLELVDWESWLHVGK